jgi:hypothetical protein
VNHTFLPRTAEEMIDFIGSHFECHQHAKEDGTPLPPDMNRFTLTVHDLLSAFHWAGWYEEPPRAETTEETAMCADLGKQMLALNAMVRGPDDWREIPNHWFQCLQDRARAKAELAKLRATGEPPGEPSRKEQP